MHQLEREIMQEIEFFVESEGKSPTVIIFPKPKCNDLLLLDASYFGEPYPFLGRDGVKSLEGRKICGLLIKLHGWGRNFSFE